jgi:hypothetical protein
MRRERKKAKEAAEAAAAAGAVVSIGMDKRERKKLRDDDGKKAIDNELPVVAGAPSGASGDDDVDAVIRAVNQGLVDLKHDQMRAKAAAATTATVAPDGKDATDTGASTPNTHDAAATATAVTTPATGDSKDEDDSKDGETPDELAPRKKKFWDVRCAVVGNVDSGKSTLIGVLTGGELDNGRGLARERVFIHRHELGSGRTSCISQHIMGFDNDNKVVHQPVAASASSLAKTKSWKEVVSQSRSLVTFIDLAGHEKYLKTTIAGLTGCYPDYALIIINSLAGVTKMTKEHLGVCLALEIPLCCIVTKVFIPLPNDPIVCIATNS